MASVVYGSSSLPLVPFTMHVRNAENSVKNVLFADFWDFREKRKKRSKKITIQQVETSDKGLKIRGCLWIRRDS